MKKASETPIVPKKLYRCDDYSNGDYTDPVEVLAYEMGELGNSDVPAYCYDKYHEKMTTAETDMLNKAVDDIENGVSEAEAKEIAKNLIAIMERVWGIKIVKVMWLATKAAVKELYADGDESELRAHETSPYILSDLGYDGILFAYPK